MATRGIIHIEPMDIAKFIFGLAQYNQLKNQKLAEEFEDIARRFALGGHERPYEAASEIHPAGAEAFQKIRKIGRRPVMEMKAPAQIIGAPAGIPEEAGYVPPPEGFMPPVYAPKMEPAPTGILPFIKALVKREPYALAQVPVTEPAWPQEYPITLAERVEANRARALLDLTPQEFREMATLDLEKLRLEKQKLDYEEQKEYRTRLDNLKKELARDYDWSQHPFGLLGLHYSAEMLASHNLGVEDLEALTPEQKNLFKLPPKKAEPEKLATDYDKIAYTLFKRPFIDLTPEQKQRVKDEFIEMQRTKEKPSVQLIRNKETGEEMYIEVRPGTKIPSGWESVKPPTVSIQLEKVPENIRAAYMEVGRAEALVDKLSEMWNKLPHYEGLMGRVHGYGIEWASKTGLAPEVKAYQDFVNGTLAPLIRALGERGALAEGDVQRAIALVPKYPDTKEEAKLKIQSLKELIRRTKENIAGAAILTPDILQKQVTKEAERFRIIEVK